MDEFGRWEYLNLNVWTHYDPLSDDILQDSMTAGKTNLSLAVNGSNYEIDFVNLTQTNIQTKKSRAIRFTTSERIVLQTRSDRPASISLDAHYVYTDAYLEDDTCNICLLEFDKKRIDSPKAKRLKFSSSNSNCCVRLLNCKGHFFHVECITKWLSVKPKCPTCSNFYGEEIGDQPLNGVMAVRSSPVPLPGYLNCGTLELFYHFPRGTQTAAHPNPGVPYMGTQRRAFLPNNTQGRKVARLLLRAFDNRVSFTVGTSLTTGRPNCVIWNGIHHKTNRDGGPHLFGYPDPCYLNRVTLELAAKGIV